MRGEQCLEPSELTIGENVVRGIPQMKVQLVHDETHYPRPWANGPYLPRLYVDEFWLTNDALVKLNGTERDRFQTQVTLALALALSVKLNVILPLLHTDCLTQSR